MYVFLNLQVRGLVETRSLRDFWNKRGWVRWKSLTCKSTDFIFTKMALGSWTCVLYHQRPSKSPICLFSFDSEDNKDNYITYSKINGFFSSVFLGNSNTPPPHPNSPCSAVLNGARSAGLHLLPRQLSIPHPNTMQSLTSDEITTSKIKKTKRMSSSLRIPLEYGRLMLSGPLHSIRCSARPVNWSDWRDIYKADTRTMLLWEYVAAEEEPCPSDEVTTGADRLTMEGVM